MRFAETSGFLMRSLAAAFLLLAGAGAAPALAEDSLAIALGAHGAYFTPIYLASVNGYAKEQGLELKITNVNANVLTVVVGGQADLGGVGLGAAFAAAQNGKETSIVWAIESAL